MLKPDLLGRTIFNPWSPNRVARSGACSSPNCNRDSKLTLTLTRWVRNKEREFAAAGLHVQGASAVFAALDAAQQQTRAMT